MMIVRHLSLAQHTHCTRKNKYVLIKVNTNEYKSVFDAFFLLHPHLFVSHGAVDRTLILPHFESI